MNPPADAARAWAPASAVAWLKGCLGCWTRWLGLAFLGRDSGVPLCALSLRFVPNEIFQVTEIPRTLSGKKQERPRLVAAVPAPAAGLT